MKRFAFAITALAIVAACKPVVSTTNTASSSNGACVKPTNTPPWLGGAWKFEAGNLQSGGNFAATPGTKVQCTALFEFSKEGGGYKVRIISSDSCTDEFHSAKSGQLSVWKSEAAGYIKVKVTNPKYDELVATLNDTPSSDDGTSPRLIMLNTAQTALLVPLLPADVTSFLPKERAGDTAYLCGDGKKDTATPSSCIWPQGMQFAEYPVEAEPGSSTAADLDALVAKTEALQSQRLASGKISLDANNALKAYQTEWATLQESALRLRHWVFLNRVLNGSKNGNGPGCNSTPERRAQCARAVANHLIPQKKDFIEKAITAKFPESMSAQFRAEMQTGVLASYTEQLGKVVDRWKSIVKLMQVEKGALAIAANLPTATMSAAFQLAPLFPASPAEENVFLKESQWSVKEKFLDLSFVDSKEKLPRNILRRSIDKGAVIMFGNYPISALGQRSLGDEVVLPAPQAGVKVCQ